MHDDQPDFNYGCLVAIVVTIAVELLIAVGVWLALR